MAFTLYRRLQELDQPEVGRQGSRSSKSTNPPSAGDTSSETPSFRRVPGRPGRDSPDLELHGKEAEVVAEEDAWVYVLVIELGIAGSVVDVDVINGEMETP